MAERFLYLIRHGQYHYHHDLTNQLGGTLTDLGCQQASLAATALRDLPLTSFHCSNLLRAEQTAEIIAEVLPNHLARQSSSMLQETLPCVPIDATESFFEHRPQYTPERIAQNRERADEAFTHYFTRANSEDEHDLLVCHGNLIRFFVCRVLDVPCETFFKLFINNCGLSIVKIEADGNMWLMGHNSVAHLPPDMQTEM